MDFSPDALDNKRFEPIAPGQKGFGPASLGHKDFSLATLRHKDFGPTTFGQKNYEPIALGHRDFGSATTGLNPDPTLAKVDPVHMSIRVATTWFDLVTARADLAAVKATPTTAEVDLVRT